MAAQPDSSPTPHAPTSSLLTNAGGSALLAASICLVLTFIIFSLLPMDIAAVLAWMLALSLLAFGATYTGVWIVGRARGRR